jgi:hypothetical protein
MLNVRDIQAPDIARVARYALPRHFWGFAADWDGELVGVGFVFFDAKGDAWATTHFDPVMRRHKVTIHRIAKMLVRCVTEACGVLYTMQSSDEPTSGAWLTRLGFQPTDQVALGERVWACHRR